MTDGTDFGRTTSRPRLRTAVVTAAAALAVLLTGCSAGAAAPGGGQAAAATTSPSAPSPSAAPAPTTAPAAPAPPEPLTLNASGPAVSALQQRLSDLGYWLGDGDGTYGQLTRQAVIAFQKAEGLDPDGVAGPLTMAAAETAERPTARSTSGDHLEVDLERQLLLVVRGGEVQWAFNTSTGNGDTYQDPSGGSGVATTPAGDFVVQRQIDGVRVAPLGELYRPKYFNGGIAVHGAGSVPAFPASHGCVRVTNAAMDLLWSSGVAEVGSPVAVY